MGVTSNIQLNLLGRWMPPPEEMAAYDSLPPAVRDAMKYAIFEVNAAQVAELLESMTYTEEQIIWMIEFTNQAALNERVYG